MRRSPWMCVLTILGGLAGAAALVRPATATERTVTDCGDTVPGGAAGQLRRLITDATDGDMILIPACTITLQGAAGEDANQTGDLDVDKDLTLQGAGPTRTILDGGATDRVLHILVGRTVGVSALTVRNGKADSVGGGIFSFGRLQLANVEVTGNEATGGSGGGVYLGGPATLSHVTVADNLTLFFAGGLWVTSPGTSLFNVTLSGNRAAGSGGGLVVAGSGTAPLNNVTITANQGNSDGVANEPGGGLAIGPGATVELRNTLVAGNSVGSGGSDPDCYVFAGGTLRSLGANLIQQVTAGCPITGITTTNLAGVAPGLGPLQANGGPTRTHALLPGSPALDHGDGACAFDDQRGVRRPQGPRCDIGAYERLRLAPGRLEGGRLQ